MIHSDILIIGAGITGTAVAQALSRFNATICVVDRACDIADGATKANSGIVHAGYDAVPGTLKAKYNVRGASLYPDLCKRLDVPYIRCGAMVIALSRDDVPMLYMLEERGKANGVSGLQIVNGTEALRMEPNLNPDVVAALEIGSSAIVSPYELAFALADDAAVNGTRFFFGQEIISVSRSDNRLWSVCSSSETFVAKVVINCAGASGAVIHNLISDQHLNIIHRRGQYYLLDRAQVQPFSRTVFQCPTRMGKGVLISPTVHGNLIIGPNAEDIADPLDTETTDEGLAEVIAKAALTWPSLSARTNITNFSGVRAHLETGDFIVGAVSGAPGIFEAVGIESPGLSSAPAIAEDLAAMVSEYLSLTFKERIISCPSREKPFHEMSDEERKAAVASNPMHGRIICRCETVTEAEIRAAVRRPVGARTIDGIKRRTRAGMGRCQGGFCSPRVASILAEELGCSLAEITKSGGGSFLLSGTLADFLKAGDFDD